MRILPEMETPSRNSECSSCKMLGRTTFSLLASSLDMALYKVLQQEMSL